MKAFDHKQALKGPEGLLTLSSRTGFLLMFLLVMFVLPSLTAGEMSTGNETTTQGESPRSFAGGDGTIDDPYKIFTIEDLQMINDQWAYSQAHFILMNDIDASGIEFIPISWYFQGSIDGNHYEISGLNIDRENENGVAMISSTGPNAYFKNIHFVDVSIKGNNNTAVVAGILAGTVSNVTVSGTINGTKDVGSIAGSINTNGNVENVSFSEGTIEGESFVGGIAGSTSTGISITNAAISGDVIGTGDKIGGIVGDLNTGCSIDNVIVEGKVEGDSLVGGIAGSTSTGISITNAAVSGDVIGEGDYVGGIVGDLNTGGIIENVIVEGKVEGDNNVGGIVGFANTNSNITNAEVSADIIGQEDDIGGIVGYINSGGNIENVIVQGKVEGDNNVGGVAGYTHPSNNNITNADVSAKVTGNKNIGGLVGFNNEGTITKSHATGDVIGYDANIGGLVGYNKDGTIQTSYATGQVSGEKYVGGLVGLSEGSSSLIERSFSLSDVDGDQNQVGGLVGTLLSGKVKNSFFRGDVSGNNSVGGLVGEIDDGDVIKSFSAATIDPNASGQVGAFLGRKQKSTVEDSFYDEDIVNEDFHQDEDAHQGISGLQGKSTTEMKTEDTFTEAGWNFDEVWLIDPDGEINDGYPYLQGAGFPGVFKIFYSRKDGVWDDDNTWSTDGHDGDPAEVPGPNDEVQIGAGHTVTLSKNVAVAQGLVRVKDTGILDAGTHKLTAAGTFQLEAGGTLITANTGGIASSANEGSIQTNTRHFDEGANYKYNGSEEQVTGDGLPITVNDLTINNIHGVTALKDHIVTGQLVLTEGTLAMPPGASLVTFEVTGSGNVLMQQEISGGKGWRMVSSPVTDISFGTFFDGFVTQGFEGAAYCSTDEDGYYNQLQPNVLWFDETQIGTTNMGWRAPSQAGQLMQPGRGYFHYVFDGAGLPPPYDGEYFDNLDPAITLQAKGQEPSFPGGEWPFDSITYTPRDDLDDPEEGEPFLDVNMDDAGWNLVGNPTTASLDWRNDDNEWIREHIDETFYVWIASALWMDGEGDDAEEMMGEYQAWNKNIENIPEDFTSLSDGLIAPFQGFWIRATDEEATLALTQDAKTIGGDFHQKDQQDKSYPAYDETIALPLLLKAEGMTSRAYVTFSDTGHPGTDPYDGYRLEPLSNSYLEVYTANLETFSPLTINNLPADPGKDLRIPLFVGGLHRGNPVNGQYSLQWKLPSNWPADWGITLMDHHQEKAIPLTQQHEYHFHHQSNTPAKKTTAADLAHPENIVKPKDDVPAKATSKGSNRFTLVASPGKPDDDPVYTPDTPALLPPYPNPTHAMTNVQFFIPEEEYVHIRVYDIHGRLVTTLANRKFESGHHTLPTYSMNHLNNGVYVISLQTLHHKDSRKITLIK